MNTDQSTPPPHWLLESIYGRQLLKTKLRIVRPDLQIQALFDSPAHEELLDPIIDELSLRDWRRPETALERLAAIRLMLKMTLAIAEASLLKRRGGSPLQKPSFE